MTHKASILRDIMSTDVVTVEPDATLRSVAELFAMQGISGAPVVSDGRVLGVISASDIVDFAASTPDALPDQPASARRGTRIQHGWEGEPTGSFYSDWAPPAEAIFERFGTGHAPADVLQESSARDVMTSGVRSLPADTGLHEAAEYMLQYGIHRVLVMDGSELVGLVSTLDFLRALAERRL